MCIRGGQVGTKRRSRPTGPRSLKVQDQVDVIGQFENELEPHGWAWYESENLGFFSSADGSAITDLLCLLLGT